jgi:adenylate cyclase class IV
MGRRSPTSWPREVLDRGRTGPYISWYENTTPRFHFSRKKLPIDQSYNDFPMQSYEVEIKSLLGTPSKVGELRMAMEKVDPNCLATVSRNKQLNHYFEGLPAQAGGTLRKLSDVLAPHLPDEAKKRLDDLTSRAKEFSVRTRDKDGTVLIVVKVSVGDDTSANGISRMEFEEKLPLSLKELDELVLSAGFRYQAKWSREREEYVGLGTNVTLDKNAGYGWLAEFERVVDDPEKVGLARKEIQELMARLGVEELSQSRLERMFSYYNTHWTEYYGTEKIFVIE